MELIETTLIAYAVIVLAFTLDTLSTCVPIDDARTVEIAKDVA